MSFEIWIFRNGQPDRDDNSRIVVPMTSTQEQRRLVLAAFASAAEICPENHCTVQVNSIQIFTHIPLLDDHAYVLLESFDNNAHYIAHTTTLNYILK